MPPSADAEEPLGEVVTGPGGSVDLSGFVNPGTAIGRWRADQLFLKQVDGFRYPTT